MVQLKEDFGYIFKQQGEEHMDKQQILIERMKKEDWQSVREIYLEGIQTGNATFDTVPPAWSEWDKGHLTNCRFIARRGDRIVGWVALSQSPRKDAYRGVAEVSIYVSKKAAGMGVGSILLNKLIEASEVHGFWTLEALIFPENVASIKLHKRFDFEVIGSRKRIGKLNGTWRDVVLLERRSKIVGVD
ncbi:GNAT family N-acetyltransferase [Ornithinibacillus halotolerans]|nr:GNAT family N-acetyltransferase [Ornithinibacillus halotolerans]